VIGKKVNFHEAIFGLETWIVGVVKALVEEQLKGVRSEGRICEMRCVQINGHKMVCDDA